MYRHFDQIKNDLDKALKDKADAEVRVKRYTDEMQSLQKVVASALIPAKVKA